MTLLIIIIVIVLIIKVTGQMQWQLHKTFIGVRLLHCGFCILLLQCRLVCKCVLM